MQCPISIRSSVASRSAWAAESCLLKSRPEGRGDNWESNFDWEELLFLSWLKLLALPLYMFSWYGPLTLLWFSKRRREFPEITPLDGGFFGPPLVYKTRELPILWLRQTPASSWAPPPYMRSKRKLFLWGVARGDSWAYWESMGVVVVCLNFKICNNSPIIHLINKRHGVNLSACLAICYY